MEYPGVRQQGRHSHPLSKPTRISSSGFHTEASFSPVLNILWPVPSLHLNCCRLIGQWEIGPVELPTTMVSSLLSDPCTSKHSTDPIYRKHTSPCLLQTSVSIFTKSLSVMAGSVEQVSSPVLCIWQHGLQNWSSFEGSVLILFWFQVFPLSEANMYQSLCLGYCSVRRWQVILRVLILICRPLTEQDQRHRLYWLL